jgi:carboxyl-terminal processing protease
VTVKSVKKFAIIGTLAALVVVLTIAALQVRHRLQKTDDAAYLELFKKVLTLVKQSYVDEVDTKKLVSGAIKGMLTSLDPHSSFMEPEPFKEMEIATSGAFGGVGIEINMKEGRLTVISPIEDTPAYRAGLKPNDYIWKINDKLTKGMSINDAVRTMRGEPGTVVTLYIRREGEGKPIRFDLTRAIIKIASVRSRTLEPGYGYLRIAQFQERTGEDMIKALDKLRAESGGSLKGLVLDLRNNPGGLLDQAVAVAGRFVGDRLDNGLIVYTQGRPGTQRHELSASVGEKEPHYPLVVLVNGGSASASEIVAGALQDHKRAIIMGTQTFGKGSVQSIMPLRGNNGISLTVARYYTPSGRSIQAKGIQPDIIVGLRDLKQPFKNMSGGQEKIAPLAEKDLQNHLSAGGKPEPASPKAPRKPEPAKPASPAAHPLAGEVDPKNDFQLFRSLEMLKGLEAVNRLQQKGR